MAVTLNRRAYEHAKELINDGRFVFDERDVYGASTGRPRRSASAPSRAPRKTWASRSRKSTGV